MTICPDNKCTGCGCCYNVCPVHAIQMVLNELGESIPNVNDDVCINCKKCINSCPNNHDVGWTEPSAAFAAWNSDKNERKLSASGGIATLFSRCVISEGGVVYGTAYDENLVPKCVRVDNMSGLERLKGSKYVQCVVGHSFSDIKNDLEKGLKVLYISTPCQVSGLKSFLKNEYDNLILVDLICHGVCPTSYFLDEIDYIKKEYKLKSVTNCRFRGNDDNNFRFSLWRDEKLVYVDDHGKQPYFNGFLNNISLRSSCYQCQYSSRKRVSDITIGDFIGLGEDIPCDYDTYNVSLVMPVSDKGRTFWKNMFSVPELMIEERSVEEAVKGGISLRKPAAPSPLRSKFVALYGRKGFVRAIRSTLPKDYRAIKKMWLYRKMRSLFFLMKGKKV